MKVMEGNSLIHGKGLFSKQSIEEGEFVGAFEGTEVSEDGIHVLWHQTEDGQWKGLQVENVLKFANHSDSPNVEVVGTEMYAIKPIQEGQEITFHYGEDWED